MLSMLSDIKIFQTVEEIMKPLEIPLSGYEIVCSTMESAMARGLKDSTHHSSSIKMYPTYVTSIPNGTEIGSYLALDLGGTNYRVLLVKLGGKGCPPKIEERTYAIPSSIRTGTGESLFEYVASTLRDFLELHDLLEEACPLGFTFSFPCQQKGLSSATLVRWTKGFAATGVEGRDVSDLLQQAMNKMGLKVRCVAVVNDTVGTLASCALEDQKCAIGLIVGKGTNAAYIEQRAAVDLISGDANASAVVINTEWGAFGEHGEVNAFLTRFDKAVDEDSLYPGKQIFEKMVSGMYLGDIVRHILVNLVEEKLLFNGRMPEKLHTKNSFLTKYLTEVERDPPHLFYSTHYVLTEDLRVPLVDSLDKRIVRYVCELVSTRAAHLIGAGIACLMRRMNRPEVTVGIDGSLYKFHPKFNERMTYIIDQLKPKDSMFRLRLSEDGSGKGAAAIVAAAVR